MNKFQRQLLIMLCLAVAAVITFSRLQNQGRNVKPQSGQPNKIVSLSPNLTEILFELGLDEKIAAVSDDSDYPPQAAKKNKVGTFWQPNTEAIIACKPDLVVAESFEQQKAVTESLKKLGYEVLSLKIEKIEELFAAIEKIGSATGRSRQADELIKNIKAQLDGLRSKSRSSGKVRVLWVIQAEPLRAAGRKTHINELIELAGGENAISDTIQQYPPISTEELLASSVEVIIQSAMGTGIENEQKTAEAFWSKWQNLPAVKNHRIYVIEPDTILRLGPRLPQGAETLARCIAAKQENQ
jgi:iron complex transport system substrate-binding protein